ncbi:MAG: DUF6437 family protein [Pseudomonadota bacterium]
MPRAKNPIADLAAHREKLAEFSNKQSQLEDHAASYLGRLMLKAGLDHWDDKALKTAITRLGKLGEEKGLTLLSQSLTKRASGNGANASLPAAE